MIPLLCASLCACSQRLATNTARSEAGCNACHGGANSAPPNDTSGRSDTALVTVGAHQAHLGSSTWHREVLCSDCHVVPASSSDPGHIDAAPAELVWSASARSDGATPSFDRDLESCSGVYCHGATLGAGGSNTQPSWTTVDGTQAACGSCHGLPPPAPHPDSTACELCHGMVVDASRNFVDPGLHINGVVNVTDTACNSCHGSVDNSAPPVDTEGNSDTALLTVGAHQAHLGASDWHREVLCSDCHVVPADVDDPGHLDPAPAELIWSAIARSDGATPSFDRNLESCSGVYCHGATLGAGGSDTQPSWTTVDGTQAACGSCHGLPPPAPHPDSDACEVCHGMVVDEDRNFVDAALHINGTVNVSDSACNSCHGNASNTAPPVDTEGNSDTALVTVGAHQAHLGASDWHREVLCSDCHLVPADVDDPGHLDPAPAELIWSAISRSDGATPSFDRNLESCSGVYCHGATLGAGGSNTQPSWTAVDGTQAACGSCHGLPPPAPHPDSAACEVCHGMVVDEDRNFVDAALHINGTVNVSDSACNSCHGSVDNSAPPVDTEGNSDTALVTVGAHQAHLGASDWHREVLCSDCHLVPAGVDDPGHLDPAPAELVWSSLAAADGASPAFDRNAASCSGVYCHGETLPPGGSNTQPSWTVVDGTQDACGTCHGEPPEPPHTTRTDCGSCHGAVYDGLSFVNPSLHIDGKVQVTGECDSCHGNPPTPGNESYAGAGGAHAVHVTMLGYGCAICHGHDGSGPQHDEGGGIVSRSNVDIVFDPAVVFPGGTTMGNGTTPSESYNGGNPTCNVGCHNPVPGDIPDLNNAASWTATSLGCQGCHERPGVQAPVNHPIDGDDATVRANCQTCHDTTAHLSGAMVFRDPDPGDAFSYAAQGVEGLCRTCHDGGGGSYFGAGPPADVSSFWTRPASHQTAGYDCQTCHGHHGNAAGARLAAGEEEDLCLSCHDGQTAATDIESIFQRTSRHPVNDAEQNLFAVECIDCHDPHADTTLAPYVGDPDPADSFVPAGLNADYCLTCHDGQQARDMTVYVSSAHDSAALGCTPECHVADAGIEGSSRAPLGPHGSQYSSLASFFEEDMCAGCHDEVLEMSDSGTFTHHHVLDSEQTASSPLECVICHGPHTVKSSPWQPLTDPHTGALVSAGDVPKDASADPSGAASDTGRFCLRCHDGSWPGAANIAAELADSSVINSEFRAGSSNLHRRHRNAPNGRSGEVACNYCHNAHGSSGSSGIKRGALLYSWLTVTRFPYSGKGSCGTGDPLHRCHD